jgi:predicted acylesterase/phospholipase RssA
MEDRNESIGLALSGGGFRATLFHLGVIRYLYDSGLLPRVQTITSVSGGSILAAHLAVNWDKYNGDQKTFEDVAGELIKFTRMDVRGRIVRRWLCGSLLLLPRFRKWLTFDSLLTKTYAKLYRDATLKDLKGSSSHPDFHILATSLTTGGVCKFTSDGFVHFDWNGEERLIRNSSLPLSTAVAASSAFPPLFPPIPVSRELLNADAKDFDKTQYLTDGGVFDNLGLHELSRVVQQKQSGICLVVSDAGGNFDWTIGNTYAFFVSRNVRATDILMDRVSKLVPVAAIDKNVPLCHVFIGRELTKAEAPEAQPPEIQRGVRNIRTDLDAFSMPEIGALINQGYEEARFSLRAAGIGISLRGNNLSWNFVADCRGANPEKLEIEDAKRRRLRLFVIRDPATWVLIVLCLMWMLPFVAVPLYSRFEAEKAKADLQSKTNELDDLTEQLGVGGVVQDENGVGLEGVNITIRGQQVSASAVSAEGGAFFFRPLAGLRRGDIFSLVAEKRGYRPEQVRAVFPNPRPFMIILAR